MCYLFSVACLHQDVMQGLRYTGFINGRTHTSEALRIMKDEMFAPTNGDRESAQNIAIIFTDGGSNIEEEMTVQYAIDARVKGIHIIVVAVGEDRNMLELQGIASEPVSSNLFAVGRYWELPGLKDGIIQVTCNGGYRHLEIVKLYSSNI